MEYLIINMRKAVVGITINELYEHIDNFYSEKKL